MKDKKVLIISIEIAARELIPKCLLALEAAKQGYRVYISTLKSISFLENHLDSCIFLHKSTYESKVLQYQKTLGAQFIILDEEAGFAIPRSTQERFIHDRYPARGVTADKYKHIFTIGESYKRILEKMPNCSDIGIHATGWPRIDLWREEYQSTYQNDVVKLKAEHGDYFLMISSFGITSEKTYQERKLYNEKYFPYGNFTLEHRFESLKKYIENLKTLSTQISSDEKIIFRPHTSENIQDWRDHFSDFKNIEVHHEGDVTPWILASKALIQHGSTVGIQAALNGIPSIQLDLKEQTGITDTPNFEISHNVNSPIEAYQELHAFCTQSKDTIRDQAIKLIKEEVSSLSGSTATEKIITVLNEMRLNEQNEIEFSFTQKVIHNILTSLSHIKQRILYNMPWRKATFDRTAKEKTPNGIQKSEIIKIANELNQAGTAEYKFKQVSTDLVSIESLD